MNENPRPEPGVSYAGGSPEFRAQSRLEAAQSLASWLGVELRAAAVLLEDETALAAEIRSHQSITATASNRLLAAMGDTAAAERVTRRAWRP